MFIHDTYDGEMTEVHEPEKIEPDDESPFLSAQEKEHLSVKDAEEIRSETGWSDEVLDSIRSKPEADIYKEAELSEKEVDGRICLVKNDIDPEMKDEFGRTNQERMEHGNAPLTASGETIELHHIGQRQESPLAELTTGEHRGRGNDAILHDKTIESEINRTEFARERVSHWQSRAEQLQERI